MDKVESVIQEAWLEFENRQIENGLFEHTKSDVCRDCRSPICFPCLRVWREFEERLRIALSEKARWN